MKNSIYFYINIIKIATSFITEFFLYLLLDKKKQKRKEYNKRYKLRKGADKLIEETETSDHETKKCIEKLMLCLKKRHRCFDECSNNNKKRCIDDTPEISLLLHNTKRRIKITRKCKQKLKKVSF